VILSDELNRALHEMHIKERYKEILFILDTCEGMTLFDSVDVPNVYFVTSSLKDQKAHSYSYDQNQMTPTADKFHFRLNEHLERIYKTKNFKYKIHDIFLAIQKEKAWLGSDVAIINRIQRDLIFEEFFGNHLKKNEKNVKYSGDTIQKLFSVNNSPNNNNKVIDANYILMNEQSKLDNEVLKIKTYNENIYTWNKPILNKNDDMISTYVMNSILVIICLNIVYMIIKK
jgi:glycosylphosphatidylinositol transamidase (GPIT) subunit GPI8